MTLKVVALKMQSDLGNHNQLQAKKLKVQKPLIKYHRLDDIGGWDCWPIDRKVPSHSTRKLENEVIII